MKENKKQGLKTNLKVFRVLNRLHCLEQSLRILNNSYRNLSLRFEMEETMRRTDRLVYASASDLLSLKIQLKVV
jgi:hypothetical protein